MTPAPLKISRAVSVAFIALGVLHILGIGAYVTRQVLVPVWLWENQDYQLYLSQYYYHAYIVLMAVHVYLWGPFLIARHFHGRAWPLYWASFVVAFVIAPLPLLKVQRFAELHGARAEQAVWGYAVLLGVYFLYQLIGRRTKPEVVAFHVFSGLPLILLFLKGKTLLGVPNGWVVWGLLVVHVVVAVVLQSRGFGPVPASTKPSRLSITAGGLLIVIAAVACLPHQFIELLYAKKQLEVLLDGVGYARIPVAAKLDDATPPPDHERFRTYDGTWNNLDHPEIGRAGTPLGRYLPESGEVPRDVLGKPEVTAVSNTLLRQTEFRSAAPINALAMAWVNFFVHDFYNRGVTDTLGTTQDYYKIPAGDGRFMYMGKLQSTDGHTHLTKVTHWFDGSQVYGSDEATSHSLRTMRGGRMKLEDNGLLPMIEIHGQKIFQTGDSPRSSLHIGSMIMHTLWVHEHNDVANELARHYPNMTDEELFQTARLIVAAEIVKVHSVEWTAELVGDPVSSDFFKRFFDEFKPENYRADLYYAVSEEFVSSYILHEIIPPWFHIVNPDGQIVETLSFVRELFLLKGQERLTRHGPANILNSFGVNAMGLIKPFNVVEDLRRFEGTNFLFGPGHEGLVASVRATEAAKSSEVSGRAEPPQFPDFAGYVDLAAIPVARDRDARVPFYNDLRVKLGMPRLKSIREITNEPETIAALESLYPSVDQIEYVIGYKAESRPSKWALTPTQIRTFLPVVIYRILADRFYTKDFTEKTYTAYGMQRIKEIRFYDIIKRAFNPSLLPKNRDHPIFYQWNT
jgi:hypothetical protein